MLSGSIPFRLRRIKVSLEVQPYKYVNITAVTLPIRPWLEAEFLFWR